MDFKDQVRKLSERVARRKDNIQTTKEGLEGFFIVRSFLRPKISAHRITFRDTLSCFVIFLDDNNRRPVAGFILTARPKSI
ncbi:hypothetical protein GCM10027275_16600 [Rhabdobacter roseus]